MRLMLMGLLMLILVLVGLAWYVVWMFMSAFQTI
jgi:hypothetical protein